MGKLQTDFSKQAAFLRRLDAAGLDAVETAADLLLEVANRTVPLDKSPLQNSGDVDTAKTPTGWKASVYYDTPYAVKQHEDTTLRHKPGRRARWLELAAQEERERLQQEIKNRLEGLT